MTLKQPHCTPDEYMNLTREVLVQYYQYQIERFKYRLDQVESVNWEGLFDAMKFEYHLTTTSTQPVEQYAFMLPELIQRIEEILLD